MTDEAHFPAEPPCAQASPRLPRPLGDPRRPQGPGGAPRSRPQVAVGLIGRKAAGISLATLNRRADFLAANTGRRAPTPAFVLLVRERGDGSEAIRVGYTVTKKIGGAVVRNRMKRRFRALASEILPGEGIAGADHVLIGRADGVERPFDDLKRELSRALARIRSGESDKDRRPRPRGPRR